jgi:predicted Fe-S protein YdhL (DUF1289 family)
MISSPCIKVCTLDRVSRLCVGCGRSLDEIARWGTLSETQRLDIILGLKARMTSAGLNPGSQETQL